MSKNDCIVGIIKMLTIDESNPKIGGCYWIATRSSLRVKNSRKRRVTCAIRLDRNHWFAAGQRIKHSDITEVSQHRIDDKRVAGMYGSVRG